MHENLELSKFVSIEKESYTCKQRAVLTKQQTHFLVINMPRKLIAS